MIAHHLDMSCAGNVDDLLRGLATKIREYSLGEVNNVDNFLIDLAAKMRYYYLAEAAINRKTADRFSPFKYINLDEEMSSCILADLFNPAGEHGQGRLFLDSFLKLCGRKDFLPGPTISVKCEARTYGIVNSRKRMDIELKGQGRRSLAVENKIWAEDGDQQVLEYLNHLKRTTDGFCLVYLAPEGRDISEKSLPPLAREEFRDYFEPIAWQDLLKDLKQCKEQVEAQKLRFFLDDFIRAMSIKLSTPLEEIIWLT